jgi:hypothetical protein
MLFFLHLSGPFRIGKFKSDILAETPLEAGDFRVFYSPPPQKLSYDTRQLRVSEIDSFQEILKLRSIFESGEHLTSCAGDCRAPTDLRGRI